MIYWVMDRVYRINKTVNLYVIVEWLDEKLNCDTYHIVRDRYNSHIVNPSYKKLSDKLMPLYEGDIIIMDDDKGIYQNLYNRIITPDGELVIGRVMLVSIDGFNYNHYYLVREGIMDDITVEYNRDKKLGGLLDG